MKGNKFLTILLYIFIAILLLPFIAVGLYLALGGIIYIILFIIDRVKNGKRDPEKTKKEGSTYRISATVIVLVAIFLTIVVFKYQFDITTWSTYFVVQAIAFAGSLPLCALEYIRIKHPDNEEENTETDEKDIEKK